MEPEELRKLRIAHGLTPGGLAAMLGTSSDVVLGWEASKRTPQHIPIEPETRRSILRTLAVLSLASEGTHPDRRSWRQREAVLPSRSCLYSSGVSYIARHRARDGARGIASASSDSYWSPGPDSNRRPTV